MGSSSVPDSDGFGGHPDQYVGDRVWRLRDLGAGAAPSRKVGEMKRSGQDARRPPEAVPPAGGDGPTRQPKATELEAQAVIRLIGVAVLLRLLRSRRFWERLAVGGIVLGALARMGQENGASTMARLAAWNKRQAGRLERQAGRQAGRLERQAERQGRRLVRKAKGPLASKP